MTQGSDEQQELTRRDWILLPLLSLLTVFTVLAFLEAISRVVWRASSTTTLSCLVVDDASTGVRGIPNTVCHQKIYESGLIEYKFNACGHRTVLECGPKSPGAFRIVLVGSSFPFGMWVPVERSFAALLPGKLSQQTGRKVELYNEAMQWGTPHSIDLRFKDILEVDPDMILWTVTPFDIENASLSVPYVPVMQASSSANGWSHLVDVLSRKSVPDLIRDGWRRAIEWLDQTRSVFLLRHLLYLSQSQYVQHYVLSGERGFLEANSSAAWQVALGEFNGYVADLLAKANAAGVPMVVTVLPQRAQAAMISRAEWPANVNPYKVSDDVRSVVKHNGGIYIDILKGFRGIPNSEAHYFPVDGHIDPKGHSILAELLAQRLTADPSSPLYTGNHEVKLKQAP
jgi:hypothetical protein